MPNCEVCGNDFLRCNCESQQPFCEQCSENTPCNYEVDSKCVTYHPLPTTQPSNLDNLGLPNGSTAEQIFEAIDDFLGNSANISITAVDTNSIDITANGIANHTLRADIKVSPDSLNQLEVRSNGVYAKPYNENYFVKVDATDTPNYLEEQIVGGSDGVVSISVVNTSGLLGINPSLNISGLVAELCPNTDFVSCIASKIPPITPVDTNSINLTVSGSDGHTLQADAIISPDANNALAIRGNGLYATGGTTSARNGLSISSGFAELGGTLLHDTSVDHDSTYQLNFTNHPRISIGSSTAIGSNYLSLYCNDNTVIDASVFMSDRTIDNTTSPSSLTAFTKVSGGPVTQTGNRYIFGGSGQLWANCDIGSFTLSSGASNFYTGIYGAAIKSGTNNISGNILSGGYFIGTAADSGNVADLAAIRAGGVYTPPGSFGSTFSGTITNYYGLYIDNISTSSLASSVTNKFAIYQVGTSDISRFFGPVQNAGGSTQFTSDSRVKENISPFTRGLHEIEQINTKRFNYTYNKNSQVTGVIAQELEAIIPEAVTQGNFTIPEGESFTDFRMIDQNVLFYTMLNAIKELSAKVKVLENK